MYTITFNENNGSQVADITEVPFEASLSKYDLPKPTREGYEFDGWYKDDNLVTPFDPNETMPAADLPLWAKWESDAHIVKFLKHEGDDETVEANIAGTQGVADDDYVKMPDYYTVNQKYDGLGEFLGWYWIVPGTNHVAKYEWEYHVHDDLTLFAMWKTEGFGLTYNTSGLPIDPVTDDETYKLGVEARVKDVSERTLSDARVFVGWQDPANSRVYYPGNFIVMSGDTTLNARYVDPARAAQVTYHANDGTGEFETFSAMKGEKLPVANSMFTRTGYTFTGWNTQPDGKGDRYLVGSEFTVSDNMHLYAQWEIDENQTKDLSATVDYKLGEDIQANAHVTLSNTVQVLEPSTLSTEGVEAKTFEGWKLVSITIDGAGVEELPGTVNDGAKVVYNYEIDEKQTKDLNATVDYKLGENVQTDARVTLSNTVQVLQPDTLSTKDVVAKTFTGWTLDSITINGEVFGALPETVKDKDAVVYNYVRDSFAYTVNYVDESGAAIAGAKTGEPQVFESTIDSADEVIDIEGYVFESADVDVLTIVADAQDNVINLTYSRDVVGNNPEVPGSTDTSDGLADKYQVIINYLAGANGSVTGTTSRVVTLTDAEGNNTEAATIVPGVVGVTITPDAGYLFAGWDNDPAASIQAQGGNTYTYTANFSAIPVTPALTTPPVVPVGPVALTPAPTAPAPEAIADDATPLADAPLPETDTTTEAAQPEAIADEATPLVNLIEQDCWIHHVMFIGIVATVSYGAVLVGRRARLANKLGQVERDFAGSNVKDAQSEGVRTL